MFLSRSIMKTCFAYCCLAEVRIRNRSKESLGAENNRLTLLSAAQAIPLTPGVKVPAAWVN